MRYLLVVLSFFLMGCAGTRYTEISDELLSGYKFREEPIVEIIEYNTSFEVNWKCSQYIPGMIYIKGCALVPADPSSVCTIYVLKGDTEVLEHEYKHCQGYADKWVEGNW